MFIPEILDVAVIGGGPAGVATVHALLAVNPELKIKIFERDHDLNSRGAGIRLEPHGLKALFSINKTVGKDILAHSITLVKHTDLTNDGIVLGETDALEIYKNAESKYGFGYPTLRWSDLRKCLINHLPSGILELDWKFFKLEEEADYVQIYFRVGEKKTESIVKARFVIGADGYFSRVRSQVVSDGHPNFQNAINWRAYVPKEDLKVDLEPYSSKLFLGDNRIALVYWVKDAVIWSLSTTGEVCEELGIKLELRIGRSGIQSDSDFSMGKLNKNKETCLKVFENFTPEITELIASTDNSAVLQHGVYIRDEASFSLDSFGVSRVALVGDAVHILGTSTAFGDAHTLALAVLQVGLGTKTTERYAALRFEFIRKSLATTGSIGAVIFGDHGNEANSAAETQAAGFDNYKNSYNYQDLEEVALKQQTEDVNNLMKDFKINP